MAKVSYRSARVSIGIDVHKRHYTVTCVAEGEVVKKATMPAEPEVFVKFVEKYFEGAEVRTAYEAGFSGFRLHRALEGAGIKNIVVHAASIEVAARDRVKTDRRDSLKIAEQLESGRLRGIRVPSEEEERNRLLHRTREQLVRKRTQLINQLRMRLYQFGITVSGAFNRTRIEPLMGELCEELRFVLESLLRLLDAVNEEIKKIVQTQTRQAKADKNTATYTSLPGIGFQTARVLSNELGDMKHFPNERTISSFVGLTPTERSSGDTQRKGHISRQGSARLRCVLVESAWTAVRYSAHWRAIYQKFAVRIGGKRAIVAVARKLICVARTLLRKNELYQEPLAVPA